MLRWKISLTSLMASLLAQPCCCLPPSLCAINVHIGRLKTPSTIIVDRQLTDTFFGLFKQSMTFIVSHIRAAFEFDGCIQRNERFAFPLPALREALQHYLEIDFEVNEFACCVMVTFKRQSIQPESQPESDLSLIARVLQTLALTHMGKSENSTALGQKNLSGQLKKVIRALLAEGLIKPTLPVKRNSLLPHYQLAKRK